MILGLADASLRIDGKTVFLDPPAVFESGQVFVSAAALAAAIGMTAKTVAPDRLVVLCTEVACVPVHLRPGDARTIAGRRVVNLERLAGALGYKMEQDGSTASLTRPTHVDAGASQVLAEGSMLPDVVVSDLAGRPVHLAKFLGRRLLICTWASW
ncbi:MAG: TlpA family protein disulfide reductase [Phycisphaerae bacterium]